MSFSTTSRFAGPNSYLPASAQDGENNSAAGNVRPVKAGVPLKTPSKRAPRKASATPSSKSVTSVTSSVVDGLPAYMRATASSSKKGASDRKKITSGSRLAFETREGADTLGSVPTFGVNTKGGGTPMRRGKHGRFSMAGSHFTPRDNIVDAVGLGHGEGQSVKKSSGKAALGMSSTARFQGQDSYLSASLTQAKEGPRELTSTHGSLVSENGASSTFKSGNTGRSKYLERPDKVLAESQAASRCGGEMEDQFGEAAKGVASMKKEKHSRFSIANSYYKREKGAGADDVGLDHESDLVTKKNVGKIGLGMDSSTERFGKGQDSYLQKAFAEAPKEAFLLSHGSMETENGSSSAFKSGNTGRSKYLERPDKVLAESQAASRCGGEMEDQFGEDAKGVASMKKEKHSRFSLADSYYKREKGAGADDVGLDHESDLVTKKNVGKIGLGMDSSTERFGKGQDSYLQKAFAEAPKEAFLLSHGSMETENGSSSAFKSGNTGRSKYLERPDKVLAESQAASRCGGEMEDQFGEDAKGVASMKKEKHSRFSLADSYYKREKGAGADDVGLDHESDLVTKQNVGKIGVGMDSSTERFGKGQDSYLAAAFTDGPKETYILGHESIEGQNGAASAFKSGQSGRDEFLEKGTDKALRQCNASHELDSNLKSDFDVDSSGATAAFKDSSARFQDSKTESGQDSLGPEVIPGEAVKCGIVMTSGNKHGRFSEVGTIYKKE